MPSVFPGFAGLGEAGSEPAAVGAALARHRRATGLSQAEVADRMGTSQPAVARLEAGAVDARLSTLHRYAAALGCDLQLSMRDECP